MVLQIVNVEFLNNEPIENVITSLNFKLDKVIFFGFKDIIEKYRNTTKEFIMKYCGVTEVVFYSLSKTDLLSIIIQMRNDLAIEYSNGNKVFFDVTGGEGLILIAFGIISQELKTPMHMYDIKKGKLVELDDGNGKLFISENVQKQSVELSIERYIELRGGIINTNLHKNNRDINDEEFKQDIDKMWSVSMKYHVKWNAFTSFLQGCKVDEDNLSVEVSTKEMINKVRRSNNYIIFSKVNEILDACETEELIYEVYHSGDIIRFRYKNIHVKECLCEAGSILELHVYKKQLEKTNDCMVGVHLDWDGIIHESTRDDVLNEIDVLALDKYVPIFISCKNGAASKEALYELDTVAERFGGKYARKMLVCGRVLCRADIMRAEEMGIDINVIYD